MPRVSRSWLRQQLEFRRTFKHLEKTKTASQRVKGDASVRNGSRIVETKGVKEGTGWNGKLCLVFKGVKRATVRLRCRSWTNPATLAGQLIRFAVLRFRDYAITIKWASSLSLANRIWNNRMEINKCRSWAIDGTRKVYCVFSQTTRVFHRV